MHIVKQFHEHSDETIDGVYVRPVWSCELNINRVEGPKNETRRIHQNDVPERKGSGVVGMVCHGRRLGVEDT